MRYTGYELFWLFVIYSFVGWCAEAAFAAVMSIDLSTEDLSMGRCARFTEQVRWYLPFFCQDFWSICSFCFWEA